MPTTPKPLTTQKVGAVLRAAGFTKTYSYKSAVRGWKNWMAGFRVEKSLNPDVIHVSYRSSDYVLTEREKVRKAREEELYSDALRKAGLTVVRGEHGLLDVTL